MRFWHTSRRKISLERPLVMAILNVTPDSFSDGGEAVSVDDALRKAEQMIADGADIIDIGGESTRPGSTQIDPETELHRTLPVVTEIAKRFDTPISVDTTKSVVARALVDNGAEIINDISGLRWDARIADIAAQSGAGLVLMHSRGYFETMHSQPPVDDILAEVGEGLTRSIATAKKWGVSDDQIVLDIGSGFAKTLDQNLSLIANLDQLIRQLSPFPILVGVSRKSFIGKILNDAPPEDRLIGSLVLAATACLKGAMIVRVHDVKETVDALRTAVALGDWLPDE
ncbi:MAG: dihydropteroate synthase [Pyrinomonadaceae bacterium]